MCPFKLRESHQARTERLPVPRSPYMVLLGFTSAALHTCLSFPGKASAHKDRDPRVRDGEKSNPLGDSSPGLKGPHPAVQGLRAVERGQVRRNGMFLELPPGAAHPSLYSSPRTASREVSKRQALSHSFPGFWSTPVAGEGGKSVFRTQFC